VGDQIGGPLFYLFIPVLCFVHPSDAPFQMPPVHAPASVCPEAEAAMPLQGPNEHCHLYLYCIHCPPDTALIL